MHLRITLPHTRYADNKKLIKNNLRKNSQIKQ